jgi:hypothetical protein
VTTKRRAAKAEFSTVDDTYFAVDIHTIRKRFFTFAADRHHGQCSPAVSAKLHVSFERVTGIEPSLKMLGRHLPHQSASPANHALVRQRQSMRARRDALAFMDQLLLSSALAPRAGIEPAMCFHARLTAACHTTWRPRNRRRPGRRKRLHSPDFRLSRPSLEPATRIERATSRLQGECSAT